MLLGLQKDSNHVYKFTGNDYGRQSRPFTFILMLPCIFTNAVQTTPGLKYKSEADYPCDWTTWATVTMVHYVLSSHGFSSDLSSRGSRISGSCLSVWMPSCPTMSCTVPCCMCLFDVQSHIVYLLFIGIFLLGHRDAGSPVIPVFTGSFVFQSRDFKAERYSCGLKQSETKFGSRLRCKLGSGHWGLYCI